MIFANTVFFTNKLSKLNRLTHLVQECHRSNLVSRCIYSSARRLAIKSDEGSNVHIFDRNTKLLQRERAAAAQDVNLYDYLKDEIGYRLADRIFDIKRKFKRAADIG